MPERATAEADKARRTYGQWWEMSEEEEVTVPLDAVRRIGMAGLKAGGATEEDAAFLLETSIDKALQGDHTRGLGRLPAMVRSARAGNIDLRPRVKVLKDRGATALVGGEPKVTAALVCRFAMDLAIKKARQHGIGWVGARAQAGILTTFVKQAVAQDMIGIVMTQSFPSVAPIGGTMPLLGNAPVAFGIPAKGHEPLILDMSITESSAQGVFLSARQGQRIPEGVLQDERGNPTTDAREFVQPEWMEKGVIVARGSLRPLGGGHKGYALVFIVGLLSYLLTDTSPPWECAHNATPHGQEGSIHIAVDPTYVAGADVIKQRVDGFIDKIKASPKKRGVSEILYPGERSQQLQRKGRASGKLSIPASHYHGLRDLAKELGLGEVI